MHTLSCCYCQHPFIKDYQNKKGILDLIKEAKAEVVEVVEDLTEEQDIIEIKVYYTNEYTLFMKM